jgi:hypothetical protein
VGSAGKLVPGSERSRKPAAYFGDFYVSIEGQSRATIAFSSLPDLKEHRTVQELKKQIEALAAGLQKVSAQLEMSKPRPQIVLNNH